MTVKQRLIVAAGTLFVAVFSLSTVASASPVGRLFSVNEAVAQIGASNNADGLQLADGDERGYTRREERRRRRGNSNARPGRRSPGVSGPSVRTPRGNARRRGNRGNRSRRHTRRNRRSPTVYFDFYDPYPTYGWPYSEPYYEPYHYEPSYTPRGSVGRCGHWHDECVENWGAANPDYRGCMRYHGCL